ncbi:hypothetical protein RAS1_03270 [Phycisphaerae bacterium RAS1]|nr:hypothetical protein RAS1_03270 [Phycisphaerae bacterium RAS1]
MSRPLLAFFTLLFALPLLAWAQSESKSKQDPAELAPADALFYVGITDTAKLWEEYQQTGGYKLMKEVEGGTGVPQFDLANQITEKFSKRLAEALGVTAEQLKNPFAGPLALFMNAPPGGDFESAGYLVLVATAGDTETLKTYYDTSISKLKESASSHETAEAGDHTIDLFKSEPGDGESSGEGFDFDPTAGPEMFEQMIEKGLDSFFSGKQLPPQMGACLAGDKLVVAVGGEKLAPAEVIKGVLKQEKRGKSLAESDDHKALMQKLKPLGTVRFLVNLPRLFEMARADESMDETGRKMMKVLGADSLRSAVGHVRLGARSYDMKFEVLFLMSGERSGLASLLSMENRPLTPPPAAGPETVVLATLNVVPSKLLSEIERMVRQADPDSADQMQRSLSEVELVPGQPPIDLRKDLIDHLQEPLTFIWSITKPLGPDSMNMSLSLGHKNREALSRLLSSIPMFTSRDVQGTPVFDFAMFPIAVATTNEQIIVGMKPTVERALAPPEGEGLAAAKAFKRAARMVPDAAWLLVYSDDQAMMDALLTIAEKSDALAEAGPGNPSAMIANLWIQSLKQQAADGDLKKLRKALRYTGQSIGTASSSPDGVQFTWVTLKPDDEK